MFYPSKDEKHYKTNIIVYILCGGSRVRIGKKNCNTESNKVIQKATKFLPVRKNCSGWQS